MLRLLFGILLVVSCLSGCSCGSNSATPGEKGERGETGASGADGATGATGATGSSGMGISSNKKYDAISTDRCDTNDLICNFTGGQRVILGDGTVIVTGEWLFINSGSGNDTDMTSATMIVPSTATSGSKMLATQVRLPAAAGGDGSTQKLFIVYTVSTGAAVLVWDKSGDGAPGNSSDDVHLDTLTLSNW